MILVGLLLIDVSGVRSDAGDSALRPLPAGWAAGPAPLLEDLQGSWTVLVGPELAARWQLDRVPDQRAQMPAAPGWAAGHPDPWVTYARTKDNQRVAFGFWHWMAGTRHPAREWPLFGDLITASPQAIPRDVLERFARWERYTGYPYRGSPGVAGLIMLRGMYPPKRAPRPLWHAHPVAALQRAGEAEMDWSTPLRVRPARTVAFDRRKAYLASASTVEVAATELQHEHRPGHDFDPARAGWWKIDADPWTYHDGIPDPLHGMHALGGIWVTTPTLRMLTDLREAGVYGGYRLLESWTAPQSRLLRDWAELIRDCDRALIGRTDPTSSAVRDSLKEAYRRAVGLFGRKGGSVYRPDWRGAIIAHTRARMVEQIIRTYRHTGALPLRVDVDAVTYPAVSATNLEAEAKRLGFKLGAGLGNWRIIQPRTEAVR